MIDRRAFLKYAGSTAAVTVLGQQARAAVSGTENVRAVIIGAGIAGFRAACRLKHSGSNISVTIIEPGIDSVTRAFAKINQSLAHEPADLLAAAGVKLEQQAALEIDPVSRRVKLGDGSQLEADVLVLAPGVEFKPQPHVSSHPLNESRLRSRLASLPQGGVVVIGIPPAPYQYPQGPYVQVSNMLDFLGKYNRQAKLLLLDANYDSSIARVYRQKWRKGLVPDLVEHLDANVGANSIQSIDTSGKCVTTRSCTIEADLVAVMPPQRAASIAREAGLAGRHDWCEVDAETLESGNHANVFVLGDANDAAQQDKNAYSAMAQADRFANYLADRLRQPVIEV